MGERRPRTQSLPASYRDFQTSALAALECDARASLNATSSSVGNNNNRSSPSTSSQPFSFIGKSSRTSNVEGDAKSRSFKQSRQQHQEASRYQQTQPHQYTQVLQQEHTHHQRGLQLVVQTAQTKRRYLRTQLHLVLRSQDASRRQRRLCGRACAAVGTGSGSGKRSVEGAVHGCDSVDERSDWCGGDGGGVGSDDIDCRSRENTRRKDQTEGGDARDNGDYSSNMNSRTTWMSDVKRSAALEARVVEAFRASLVRKRAAATEARARREPNDGNAHSQSRQVAPPNQTGRTGVNEVATSSVGKRTETFGVELASTSQFVALDELAPWEFTPCVSPPSDPSSSPVGIGPPPIASSPLSHSQSLQSTAVGQTRAKKSPPFELVVKLLSVRGLAVQQPSPTGTGVERLSGSCLH